MTFRSILLTALLLVSLGGIVPACLSADDPAALPEAHYLVADGPQWERIAPPALQPGASESLTVAFNRAYIFLGTRPQGLFRYTRRDGQWRFIDTKLPSALDYGFNPKSIMVSPFAENTLYAGIEANGVYRSEDAGLSWTSLRSGLQGAGLNGICLAMHPKHAQRLFLGADGGIFRSDNAGASWVKVTAGLPKVYMGCTPSANTVLYLPHHPEVLFCDFQNAGPSEEAGVYRSLDGGTSWAPCNQGIFRDPKRLAGDPNAQPAPIVPVDTRSGRCLAATPDGSTVFCGVTGGLYRSTDRGEHWSRCGEALGMSAISCIAINPKRPRIVFAAGNGDRVYGSVDGGNSWSCFANGLRVGLEKGATGMTLNFNDAGKSYPVTMYRRVEQNMVQYLAFDPYAPEYLYAGCSSGLYRLHVDSKALAYALPHAGAMLGTLTVGSLPNIITLNPANRRVYVGNSLDNTISVIDGNADSIVATAPTGSGTAGLAVDAGAHRLYVGAWNDNTVQVLDEQTYAVLATVKVGNGPACIAVNAGRNRVYVSNAAANTVSVIDRKTNTVVATVKVGANPLRLVLDSAANRIYVSNVNDNTVSVINGKTNTVLATVPVGKYPAGITVNPRTQRIYVSNMNDNTVSVLDGKTNTVIATVPVGKSPVGITVNSRTNRIYVGNNREQTISVLNGTTQAVIATVPVGTSPWGLVVDIASNKVYLNNGGHAVSVMQGF